MDDGTTKSAISIKDMESISFKMRRFKDVGFFVAFFLILAAVISAGNRNRNLDGVQDSNICHGARSRSEVWTMNQASSAAPVVGDEAMGKDEAGGGDIGKPTGASISSDMSIAAVGSAAVAVAAAANERASATSVSESQKSPAASQTASGTNIASAASVQDLPVIQAAIQDNGFGIAAGGDLVYWSQSDLDRYFQGIRELGATWIRYDIDWQVVQPYSLQNYNWEGIDRVVATAEKFNMRSLGIITYAPQWAQSKICPSGKHCPPENAEMFARFSGEVAQRYAGRISAYEIWNEPNYQLYWYPSPDADDYAGLLKAAYVKIKESDPAAVVVTAGLTDMGDAEGVSISPLNFVKTMYGAGAKGYFDILGLHPYTYPGFSYGWPHITSIRNIMQENGDGGKYIWATEYGAPTGGPGRGYAIGESGFNYGPDYMTEDAQAEMASDIFAFQQSNDAWMGNVFWYSFCDSSTDRSSTENFFGIIRKDGTRKPVYEVLRDLFAK